MNKINFKYYIFGFIAFCLYSYINFVYFPKDLIFPDERRFWEETINIATTGQFQINNSFAWEMPLTAIIYGGFYFILKQKILTILSIRIFQSLLLILQAILISKTSYIIFKHKIAAFLNYLIILFYPFFIYYQGLLLSETLFNSFLITGFYFLYKWNEIDNLKINKFFFYSSFMFILAVYTKATLSFLPPFLIISLIIFSPKLNKQKAFKLIGLSFLIYAIGLSPWWIRNYQIFHKFIPFSTSSTANLYIGNNIANKKAGIDWNTDVEKDFVIKTEQKSEIEKMNAYKKAALSFIKNNPSKFIKLSILKFQKFWNIAPNAADYNKGIYRIISILTFTPIILLFLFSFWTNRHKYKLLLPIYLLIIYFTFIHCIFIASLRYRLPLEPFLILLAISVLINYFPKNQTTTN